MGTNYERRWHRMSQLKKHGCCLCGYNKCIDALEFHHVVPENKNFNISMGNMTRSAATIINEFHKCMLLCANCHRIIHKKQEWERSNV